LSDLDMLSLFVEFCRRKKEVSGPDIHMKTAVTGTADAGDERPWRLAVYNNFCSTPPAAAIWARWPLERMLAADVKEVEDWCRENWAGIPIRQNRRPARSAPKLARSLKTAATWIDGQCTEDGGFTALEFLNYEDAWKSLDFVYTWGRYVKVKFLETCRSVYPELAHLEAPNIRASGAWSPRTALAIIFPEYGTEVTRKSGTRLVVGGRSDTKTSLQYVYEVADTLREMVVGAGVPVTNYEMEALLCNFRQTLSTGKTFYVGRTIDSELEYNRKVIDHFGPFPYDGQFDFFKARSETFPHECLGERQGWEGVRKRLSDVLRENGYVWSDVLYDYNATVDFNDPVRR
jgi:hypothetical protein